MIRSMLLSTSPYVLQVNWPLAVSLGFQDRLTFVENRD